MDASYAYGPVTVSYSKWESDVDTANKDMELSSVAVSYTVSDELSLTYGMEEADYEGQQLMQNMNHYHFHMLLVV